MKSATRFTTFLLGLWVAFGGASGPALLAAGDLSRGEPIAVEVRLGTRDNHLVFQPKELTFDTGKLYKLVLVNPSPSKHYFSALRFAAAVWTRKVQDESMEVKGAVREIEVLPGKRAEWYFVPVQAGVFELRCVVPGHAEAGMLGRITIR